MLTDEEEIIMGFVEWLGLDPAGKGMYLKADAKEYLNSIGKEGLSSGSSEVHDLENFKWGLENAIRKGKEEREKAKSDETPTVSRVFLL